MLAKKMFVQQRRRHRLNLPVDGKCFGGQLRDEFQHRRIMRRVSNVGAPRERSVTRNQHGGMPQRVHAFEPFDNHATGVQLVVRFNFPRRESACAGNFPVKIISVRRAQSRDAAHDCAHAVA